MGVLSSPATIPMPEPLLLPACTSVWDNPAMTYHVSEAGDLGVVDAGPAHALHALLNACDWLWDVADGDEDGEYLQPPLDSSFLERREAAMALLGPKSWATSGEDSRLRTAVLGLDAACERLFSTGRLIWRRRFGMDRKVRAMGSYGAWKTAAEEAARLVGHQTSWERFWSKLPKGSLKLLPWTKEELHREVSASLKKHGYATEEGRGVPQGFPAKKPGQASS